VSNAIPMEDPSVEDDIGGFWKLFSLDYEDEDGRVFSLDLYAKSWADAMHRLDLIKGNGAITGQITGREL
jgi:hypothetical protein